MMPTGYGVGTSSVGGYYARAQINEGGDLVATLLHDDQVAAITYGGWRFERVDERVDRELGFDDSRAELRATLAVVFRGLESIRRRVEAGELRGTLELCNVLIALLDLHLELDR